MRPEASRIAIVKLGAIGDVVNSLPFVNRLRDARPDAHLTWIIAPLAHSLVAGHRAVDEFLVFDLDRWWRYPRYFGELRARRFECVIDLQRLAKSGFITRLTGARQRLGFDRARSKEASWLFTNDRIAPNPSPGTTVAQYLEFADHLGLPPQAARWDLPTAPGPAPREPGRPRVVVNAGASKEANRWEPARWASLCEELVREFGAQIELTGGPEDASLCAELSRLCAAPLQDHSGKLSLKQTAGLIEAADLFIGCDTGPLHIAVAVGTPVVALFGAADPSRTGPYQLADRVVSNPVDCSPCRKRHCFVPGHPCMTGIQVEDVLAKVQETWPAARSLTAARP